uniref:palmitoyl-protein hydrolase n=1 Tax=Riptortus pedestris TaxID=329032 RepID=R4WNY7_RIPPE|nr:conserved hypothetical protein [Riptortus pedestris]
MALEVINQTDARQTGSFIFLHGATRNGKWQKEFFIDLLGERASFKHIKIIFPTSPKKKQWGTTDSEVNLWFSFGKRQKEQEPPGYDLSEIREAAKSIQSIISEEQKNGIPLNRIIIGGISQGGIVALNGVTGFYPDVAGCIAASAVFAHDETALEDVKKRSKNPPILATHGKKDPVIPLKMATQTYEILKEVGMDVEFHEFPDAEHELTKDELEVILKWVETRIPES